MVNRAVIILVIILMFLPFAAFGQSSTTKTQKKVKDAIKVESAAQKKSEAWTPEKEELVNQIRELQTRLTWLEYQKGKHQIYVKGLEDNVASLEARKLEARKLRENLEPYLEEVVARLASFVDQDLPFLGQERQQRLFFLQNTLNDYHLDLGEKLRRVFEGLSVESTYGRMFTATDEAVPIDGSNLEVTVFRLGRLAMFYQTLDGEIVGRWNPESGLWEQLPREFNREVRRAIEMARNERSAQLIHLYLGAVTP